MDWVILECTVSLLMDTLDSPYGYDNITTSGVIGANELMSDAMMYSNSASSIMLRDDK